MWAAPSKMLDLSKCLPPMSYSGLSWGLFPSWSLGWLSDPASHPREQGPFLPMCDLMGQEEQIPCGPPSQQDQLHQLELLTS